MELNVSGLLYMLLHVSYRNEDSPVVLFCNENVTNVINSKNKNKYYLLAANIPSSGNFTQRDFRSA